MAESVNALYKTGLYRNPAALAANGGLRPHAWLEVGAGDLVSSDEQQTISQGGVEWTFGRNHLLEQRHRVHAIPRSADGPASYFDKLLNHSQAVWSRWSSEPGGITLRWT